MILQVCASVVVLGISAVVLGRALESLGLRCRAAGPAVGLLALIVIASIAIKLPGRATTAAVVLLVIDLLAAGRLVTRRRSVRVSPASVVTLVLAGCGVAVPFIAAGRVGMLGVGLDNDTANHLSWAQSLRSSYSAARYPASPGYPLGPHSLFDGVASGLGVRLDLALTGLVVVSVLMTALVGASMLPRGARWRRPVVGALAALLYLPAAYYGESAFKETLLGLALLGLVVHLQELRAQTRPDEGIPWLGLLPISILGAGAVYVYSYLALAWIVLTLVIWAVAEVAAHRSWWRAWRAPVARHGAPTAVAVGAFIVLLLPIAGAIDKFAGSVGTSPAASGAISASNIGNLAGPLPPYEALGIWNNADFRFPPVNSFHAGELGAFALAILVLGVVVSVRRRELILPAALAACAIVYWDASHGQSAYVSAKALVIAGPIIGVVIGRALLGPPAAELSRWAQTARLAVAAGFVIFAAHSSFLALRDSPVWAPESTHELLALDRITRGRTVVFLGDTDYAPWIFQDSTMSTLDPTAASAGAPVSRPTKPNTAGTPFDVDSVNPGTIDRFDYMITTTTSYASQVPNAFRLVRRLRMYELWRRVAAVRAREVIEPPGQPGAILDCTNPSERRLSRQPGVAAITRAPIAAPVAAMLPAHSTTTTLTLPAGRWSLSLGYFSQEPLTVTAAGHRWQMPAYNDRIGPYFAIGSIVSTGRPVTVTIGQQRPSILTGPTPTQFIGLAAVADPDPRRLVPLNRACGRYVDWLRLR